MTDAIEKVAGIDQRLLVDHVSLGNVGVTRPSLTPSRSDAPVSSDQCARRVDSPCIRARTSRPLLPAAPQRRER